MADLKISQLPAITTTADTDVLAIADASDGITKKITLAKLAQNYNSDDFSEGSTNLFYLNERVDDRVATLITNGTGITWNYSDAGGTLTPTVGGLGVAQFTSPNISQWTNDSAYLLNVVEDLTPQLGGALDVNGKAITGGTSQLDMTAGSFVVTTDNGGFLTPYVIANTTKIELASLGTGGIIMDATSIAISHGSLINFTSVPVRFSGLTASTVPYLDASKNLVSSAVTPTELGHVSGVTSAIQTQLNAKLANIVEDLTPTLGGHLDGNSKNITSLGTINTHTIPGGTGTFALTSDILNGIYDGNGTVPAATVATLTDTINFTGGLFGIGVTPTVKLHVRSTASANEVVFRTEDTAGTILGLLAAGNGMVGIGVAPNSGNANHRTLTIAVNAAAADGVSVLSSTGNTAVEIQIAGATRGIGMYRESDNTRRAFIQAAGQSFIEGDVHIGSILSNTSAVFQVTGTDAKSALRWHASDNALRGSITASTATGGRFNLYDTDGTTVNIDFLANGDSYLDNTNNFALGLSTSIAAKFHVRGVSNTLAGGQLLDVADITGDGALSDSPRLTFRAKYDSDPTAGVTSANFDAYCVHNITAGGASPLSQLDTVVNAVSFSMHSGGAWQIPVITAAAASAITPANGMVVCVSDTDGTFTSVGFWGYNGGAWNKLTN